MVKKGLKGGHAAIHAQRHQHQNHAHHRGRGRGRHHTSSSLASSSSSYYESANQPMHAFTCGQDPNKHTPKGLLNVGNTCYANATIQCLLNTALAHALTDPSASAIFRRYSSNPNVLAQGSGSVDSEEDCCTTTDGSRSSHSTVRRKREEKRLQLATMHEKSQWLTGELRLITVEYHEPELTPTTTSSWLYGNPTPTVLNPGMITRSPHRLCTSLRPYQQEDAHEFLRALLGTLVMHGQNKELSSLFDGLLESSVTCQSCDRPSLTRDRYMDLSLDIAGGHIRTLTDALYEFTATETLTGDNAVYCRHCDCKCTATKGLRLATAPSILVTHVKRFAFDKTGRLVRLKKKVAFPETLEIGDFMSKVNQARPPPYDLVAVLVHQGNSCDSGHYLAYVKHSGSWFKCNDSVVEPVDIDTVLSQQAYILMYEVAEMRDGFAMSSSPVTSPCSAASRKQRGHAQTQSGASSSEDAATDFLSFTSNLLCGMHDASLFSDFCHYATWGRRSSRRRRRRRHPGKESVDDLSTLGESTAESSEPRARFRRSASSGNLRSREAAARVRSSSVSAARRQQPSSNSTLRGDDVLLFDKGKLPDYTEAKMRAKRNGELPPRPNQGHRRILSSEGIR